MRYFTALLAGTFFGGGLLVSGMINPIRIRSFLDFTGDWDPSMLVVLVSALIVPFLAWRLAAKRNESFTGGELPAPAPAKIDRGLVLGSMVFGLGWGMVGWCPAPGVSVLLMGYWQGPLFFTAVLCGMALYNGLWSKGI